MTESTIHTPLVSIIVPCYNYGAYLSETLDSVYAQTYINWECIIVDDGSTDNSKQIAQAYLIKDKRYKYIYQSNKGVSAARNNGIANSSGKYILPLDADDKISVNYMEEAVAILEKQQDVKVVYCRAEIFGKAKGPFEPAAFSTRNLLIGNPIFCSAFFRRNDFNKTNGYSEDMIEGYEDWDFWLSLIGESDKVYQIPKVHFYYRIREDSRNSLIDASKEKKLRLKLYNRHKELYDKYFFLPDFIHDYYLLRNKLNNALKVNDYLVTTNDYLIGHIIMRPYRFFKKIFK